MYLIRETTEGFFVDYKIKGYLVDSYFVRLTPKKECSCQFFSAAKNHRNHFHIVLVEKWIADGKPKFAIYDKSKSGKIITVCKGIK